MRLFNLSFAVVILLSLSQHLEAAVSNGNIGAASLREQLLSQTKKTQNKLRPTALFDIPLAYNSRVSFWTQYFQNRGQVWFRDWLEESTKYLPYLQSELKSAGLPLDLAYMVMIESGFKPNAVSHAEAVGPWQFIRSTGTAYGLQTNHWIDERRDWRKSTRAAIQYLKDLYSEFGSWHLVAASYNMGENGLRRQIKKHGTRDYWELVEKKALPKETSDYVPKILAAMMIAKSPGLYGFRNLAEFKPYSYETVSAPPGTDLEDLADYLKVSRKMLKDLNSELILGVVPNYVSRHMIRVPPNSSTYAVNYFQNLKNSSSQLE